MNPGGKNGRKASDDEARVIPPRGDYQTLHAFHKAQFVYDITIGANNMDKLPHDIIGGQPLKYCLASNGAFSLYSVGWNQVDDHGSTAILPNSNGTPEWARQDWVWQ